MRFGVLGTGYWADTCHAAGLAAHPDTRLVGLWGRDTDKATAVAARYGVAAERDLDTLLEKVDAVAIAVAPEAQAQLACRAAKAGCHLLLEKPLALSPAAAEHVADTVERAGVASVTFFTWRFMESIARWLDDTVAAHEWDMADVTLLAPVLTSDSPFAHSLWRHEHGALWDAAPHVLSLLLPALGPVAEVMGAVSRADTLHMTFAHVDGGVSDIRINLKAPAGADRFAIQLWGPAGFTAAPDGDGESTEAAYALAVSALIAASAEEASSPCDVRFSADVVDVLAAAERFLERPPGARGEQTGTT